LFVVRWLLTIAILPGTVLVLVLVLVPIVILRATSGPGRPIELAPVDSPWMWIGAALLALGLALATWTGSLFARFGYGTAAPWDPPRRRCGEPYRTYTRHVRRWAPRLRPWVPPAEGGPR